MSDNKRPQYAAGWHRDISNEDYHASAGYGSTSLKYLAEKTKAHLDYKLENPEEPTDALIRGQLLHAMVLEPHLVKKEFSIIPDVDRRSNAGRIRYMDFLRHCEDYNKTAVTQEQYDTCDAMRQKIMTHPVIKHFFKSGIAEQSVYFEHSEGLMLKVRPDWVVRGQSIVFDIKTTRDASFSKFMRQAKNLGYHMSAAMYLDGLNQCQEFLDHCGVVQFDSFVWVVVENEPPHEATYYECSAEDLTEGRLMYEKLTQKLINYKASEWQGYGATDVDGRVIAEGRKSKMNHYYGDIV